MSQNCYNHVTLRARLIFALLALSVACPAATELYSWHVFDARLFSTNRFELAAHHRTRSRHDFSYFDQARFGVTFRFAVNPRLTVLGGYYFQPQQVRPHVWTKGQRPFLGLETPLVKTKSSTVALRLVTERHIHTGRSNYTRNRTSVRWTMGTGRVRPFLQNELLAVWPHFHSTRNSGGLSLRLNSELSMDVSYLYDSRRTFWGGDRQSIVTSLRWNPKFSAARKYK